MTSIRSRSITGVAPFDYCVRVQADLDGTYLRPPIKEWLQRNLGPVKWPRFRKGCKPNASFDGLVYGICGKRGHRWTFRPTFDNTAEQGMLTTDVTEIWFENPRDAMVFKLSNEVF